VVLRSRRPMRRCSVEISQPERIISVAKHARSTLAYVFLHRKHTAHAVHAAPVQPSPPPSVDQVGGAYPVWHRSRVEVVPTLPVFE